ncbi:hypothetical protein CC79DRAFT_1330543 [Sarocladium strictum]
MAKQDKTVRRGKKSRGLRNADRARPLPPDVTARNLAYEKSRRQDLNNDFVSLARLVPALAHAKRLNKNLIVKESIQHLQKRRDVCISAARDMQHLLEENERLRVEVRSLREHQGKLDCPLAKASHVTEAMAQLMEVENEISSEFPADFGEIWAGRRHRSGSSSSKADQSRAHDRTASSSPLGDSNHQPTQSQDAHNAHNASMANDSHVRRLISTEFRNSDTWDMAVPIEPQAPLLFAPELESLPPSSNAALFMPLQDAESALLEASLPTMDFSVGSWIEDTGLSYDWPSNLPQHLDFPVI